MKQPADSCATVQEFLLDYAYGELEGAPRKDVEAHVAGCERCRTALAEISGTRSLMSGLEPEPAPEAGLQSLLAYAEQAAKSRAQEAHAPRASRIWSWLVPTLGFASAAAVALLFVVKPGDSSRVLQPALPTAIAPVSMDRAPQPAPPSPVVATAPMKAEPPAAEPAKSLEEAGPKADALEKKEEKLHDAVAAGDKYAESAGAAKAAPKKAMAPGSKANDDFEDAFDADATKPKGSPQPELAKDAKAEPMNQAAAQTGRRQAEEQRMAPAAEKEGKAGGGEAIGNKYFARGPAQSVQYGYVPADQSSKTASAGMSNVAPLDGAKPAPMPAARPAEPAPSPAPAMPATGYVEAKKRDAREEEAAAPSAAAAAEMPAKRAKSEADEDRTVVTTKAAVVKLSAEELLRKGKDQSINGDYAGAETTWATFLKDYPNHVQAPDVAMWRIEALEHLGRTGDAALARAEYVRRYPNVGTGSAAGSSGPRAVPASPARAAPMEKAKAADFADETKAAH